MWHLFFVLYVVFWSLLCTAIASSSAAFLKVLSWTSTSEIASHLFSIMQSISCRKDFMAACMKLDLAQLQSQAQPTYLLRKQARPVQWHAFIVAFMHGYRKV